MNKFNRLLKINTLVLEEMASVLCSEEREADKHYYSIGMLKDFWDEGTTIYRDCFTHESDTFGVVISYVQHRILGGTKEEFIKNKEKYMLNSTQV